MNFFSSIFRSSQDIFSTPFQGYYTARVFLALTWALKVGVFLLSEKSAWYQSLRRLEPSLSGLIFYWGVEKNYPKLAHHKFFGKEL